MVKKCNYTSLNPDQFYADWLTNYKLKINGQAPQAYSPIPGGFTVVNRDAFCDEVTQTLVPKAVNATEISGSLYDAVSTFLFANVPSSVYTQCVNSAAQAHVFKVTHKIPCLTLLEPNEILDDKELLKEKDACNWEQVYQLQNPVSPGAYYFVEQYKRANSDGLDPVMYKGQVAYTELHSYVLDQDVRTILCPGRKPLSLNCEADLDAWLKQALDEFIQRYQKVDTNCNGNIDSSEDKKYFIFTHASLDNDAGNEIRLGNSNHFISYMLSHVLPRDGKIDFDLFVQVATSWDANHNGKITEGDDASLNGKLGVEDASQVGEFSKYLKAKYKIEDLSQYVASMNDWLFFYVQQQGASFLGKINAQLKKATARNYGYEASKAELIDERIKTSVEEKIPVGLKGTETQSFDKEIEFQFFQRDFNELGTVSTQRNYQLDQEKIVKFWAQHTFKVPHGDNISMIEVRTEDAALLFLEAETMDVIVVTQEAIKYLRGNDVVDQGAKNIQTDIKATSEHDMSSSSFVVVINLRSNLGILYDTRNEKALSLFVNGQEPIPIDDTSEPFYLDQVEKLKGQFAQIKEQDPLLRKIFKSSIGYNEGITYGHDHLAQALQFAQQAWKEFSDKDLVQWTERYQVFVNSLATMQQSLKAHGRKYLEENLATLEELSAQLQLLRSHDLAQDLLPISLLDANAHALETLLSFSRVLSAVRAYQRDLSQISALDPELKVASESLLLRASVLLWRLDEVPIPLPEGFVLALKHEVIDLTVSHYDSLVGDLTVQLKSACRKNCTEKINKFKKLLEDLNYSFEAWNLADNRLTWNNHPQIKKRLKSLRI